MSWADLPPSAAWRHEGARSGFEVAFFSAFPSAAQRERPHDCGGSRRGLGGRLRDRLDEHWRHPYERASSAGQLEGCGVGCSRRDGNGHWLVDGTAVGRAGRLSRRGSGILRDDQHIPRASG